MKSYDAAATIEAPPETIWALLTDAPAYAEWDSGVRRVEGSIAPGEKIKVVSEANPKRAFGVQVTEFSPGERMTWSGGMPLGLFKGVRTFAQQVKHVACANYGFFNEVEHKEPPANCEAGGPSPATT